MKLTSRLWGNTRSRLAFAISLLAVSIVAAPVLASGLFGSEPPPVPGQPPPLDVPQSASAYDQGITIEVDAALVSGTATYIRADVQIDRTIWTTPVDTIDIPSVGFATSPLRPSPSQARVRLYGNDKVAGLPVRLSPVVAGIPADILIGRIDLAFSDGTSASVLGDWHLQLELPGDLVSRLATEELHQATGQAAGGLQRHVTYAIRSTAETLVTVQYDHAYEPDAIRLLERPSVILPDGRVWEGTTLDKTEDKRTVTWQFPATDFGTELDLAFGSYAIAGPDDSVVALDMAGIIERTGLTGAFRDTARVLPSDQVLGGSGEASIIDVVIARTSGDGPANLLNVVLEGAYDTRSYDGFSLALATGETVAPIYLSNKVSTGPGNIKSGERTTVSFPFADFHDDLDGALTLLVGSRFEVVNEASVVRLSP